MNVLTQPFVASHILLPAVAMTLIAALAAAVAVTLTNPQHRTQLAEELAHIHAAWRRVPSLADLTARLASLFGMISAWLTEGGGNGTHRWDRNENSIVYAPNLVAHLQEQRLSEELVRLSETDDTDTTYPDAVVHWMSQAHENVEAETNHLLDLVWQEIEQEGYEPLTVSELQARLRHERQLQEETQLDQYCDDLARSDHPTAHLPVLAYV